MRNVKRGEKIPPEVREERERRFREFKKIRKEITEELDREEFQSQLRDLGCGDDDQEQGKPVHEVEQVGDGGDKGQ